MPQQRQSRFILADIFKMKVLQELNEDVPDRKMQFSELMSERLNEKLHLKYLF